MSRDLREEIAGGTFHIMNRGNRKAVIFHDSRDRWMFCRIVCEELVIHGVILCALCLMGNHFHMVIITPHGNRADFIGAVESRFATYSNGRYGNVGHVFQGRYVTVTIEDDIQLLTALCYVFINPVSAGLVVHLEDYRWSTYRATVGLERAPKALSLEWLQMLYGHIPLASAQRQLHEVMQEAKPVAAYFRQLELDPDPDAVKRVIRSYVGENIRLAAMPRRYRSLLRESLPVLLPVGLSGSSLASAIYEARVEHGYRIVEIARHLRMHRAAVSKIFRKCVCTHT
jgi:putative transposase